MGAPGFAKESEIGSVPFSDAQADVITQHACHAGIPGLNVLQSFDDDGGHAVAGFCPVFPDHPVFCPIELEILPLRLIPGAGILDRDSELIRNELQATFIMMREMSLYL